MSEQNVEVTGRLLTIQEFAKKLNIHCESVRRWLRKKRLRGMKVGNRWRIEPSEFGRIQKEGGV